MDFKAPIAEFMSRKPVTVSLKHRMISVKEIFNNQNIHHVLVMDQANLVGIISKEDYNKLAQDPSSSPYSKLIEEARMYNYSVEECMHRELVVLSSAERVGVALELFSKNLFNAIPIVDGGELVGLLTTHDIIKSLVNDYHKSFTTQSN